MTFMILDISENKNRDHLIDSDLIWAQLLSCRESR